LPEYWIDDLEFTTILFVITVIGLAVLVVSKLLPLFITTLTRWATNGLL